MPDQTQLTPEKPPREARRLMGPGEAQKARSNIAARDAQASYVRYRRMATGLLIAMTIVFVISHVFGTERGVWGYVRAFAEAAMVGGLADWFAVTAIFRRPLGLPIPHTAVIPRNQTRIANSVGRFIADNFLRPDLVQARVADKDLCRGIGRWLAERSQSRALAGGLVSAVPGLLDALDDETVANFLRKQAVNAGGQQLAPAVGSIIEALAQQGRHQAILDAVLAEGFRLLKEHETLIREKVSDNTGFLLKLVKADRKVADALINAVGDLVTEVAEQPDHPLRIRITEWVARFARDLRDDPELKARIAGWAREAAAHPSVAGAVSAGWTEFKAALRRDCADPEGHLRNWIADALTNIGAGLAHDAEVRAALNDRVRTLLVDLAERHGEDVAHLVAETIRSWDAKTIVDKLESNVGRDLQFIRLNGTIIGGLVGLALHGGAELLG